MDLATITPLRQQTHLVLLSLFTAALAITGCDKVSMRSKYVTPERKDKGLVVILPGIEGESTANRNIRSGLYDADIPYALALYSWGFPMPGIGMLVNQTDANRNRRQGKELAERVAAYQKKYPGRPIDLVGHSGGGGVCVFALEALSQLPGAKPIEGAFLLSASISSSYPMGRALRMTRKGIVNVANPEDGLLNSGTATFGNVDGKKGPSAGRVGFVQKSPKLFERRVTAKSLGTRDSAHFVATNRALVARRAPLWLNAETWPVAGLR